MRTPVCPPAVSLCLAMLASFGVASATNVSITSPANGTVIPISQTSRSISFSVTGATAGIQRITVSGERDPFGDSVYNFNAFPPTNNYSNTAPYDYPLPLVPGETLTVTVSVLSYADDPVSTSIDLIVNSATPTPSPTPTPTPTPTPVPNTRVNFPNSSQTYDDAVVDVPRNRIYMVDVLGFPGVVDVFSTTSNTFVSTYSVGNNSRDGDLSPDGNTLAVTDFVDGNVRLISLPGGSTTSIPTSFTNEPYYIAYIGNDGDFLLGLASTFSSTDSARFYDSGTASFSVVPGTLSGSQRVVRSGNYQRALIIPSDSALPAFIVDPSLTVLASAVITGDRFPADINFDGSRCLIAGTVYDASLQPLFTLPEYYSPRFLNDGRIVDFISPSPSTTDYEYLQVYTADGLIAGQGRIWPTIDDTFTAYPIVPDAVPPVGTTDTFYVLDDSSSADVVIIQTTSLSGQSSVWSLYE